MDDEVKRALKKQIADLGIDVSDSDKTPFMYVGELESDFRVGVLCNRFTTGPYLDCDDSKVKECACNELYFTVYLKSDNNHPKESAKEAGIKYNYDIGYGCVYFKIYMLFIPIINVKKLKEFVDTLEILDNKLKNKERQEAEIRENIHKSVLDRVLKCLNKEGD